MDVCLGFSIRAEAGLETLTLEVVKSSAIEKESLDVAQVRSSLALGLELTSSACPACNSYLFFSRMRYSFELRNLK